MKSLAILGKPEFTLGFRLTGIRQVIEADEPEKKVEVLLENKGVGIVILDEETMNNLKERTKEKVMASIDPIFVVVSAKATQDKLRKMVIQSIGVDLLREDN